MNPENIEEATFKVTPESFASEPDLSFEIKTESGSIYQLDMPAEGFSTLRRMPAEDTDYDNALRRDGESIPVVKVIQMQIGLPLIALVKVLDDESNTLTLRQTSPVVRVQELTGALE